MRDYSSRDMVLWEVWSRCGENYVGGLAMWNGMTYINLKKKILFMAKLGGENILEIIFLTLLVKQVVYVDKFKLFDPRVVRVKKFEFA